MPKIEDYEKPRPMHSELLNHHDAERYRAWRTVLCNNDQEMMTRLIELLEAGIKHGLTRRERKRAEAAEHKLLKSDLDEIEIEPPVPQVYQVDWALDQLRLELEKRDPTWNSLTQNLSSN